MPPNMEPTGVTFDSGYAAKARGPYLQKTGENFRGEATGRVLREKRPPTRLNISGQGANLAAFLRPFLKDSLKDLIQQEMQNFMRNPPSIPPGPPPTPPTDEEIDNLPVDPDTKEDIRTASPSMQRLLVDHGEALMHKIFQGYPLRTSFMVYTSHGDIASFVDDLVALLVVP